jgi:hypothetical protein
MFGGLRADRSASEQLLQAVSPFAIEAAMEALDSLQGVSDERSRQKILALENARYEVTRAKRQYDAVDAENRLLARNWNAD